MKKFYTNFEFFHSHLNGFLELSSDFYLRVDSFRSISDKGGRPFEFEVGFYLYQDGHYLCAFEGLLYLTSSGLYLDSIFSFIDSDLNSIDITSFPLSPSLRMFCSDYNDWISCVSSSRVYFIDSEYVVSLLNK